MTSRHITAVNNQTNVSSFVTPSIAPNVNELVIVSVVSSSSAIPTVTGAGGTWVLINSYILNNRMVSMFRDLSATPGSGPLTISFGGVTQTYTGCSVDGFTGTDITGTHGSGAIGQIGTNHIEGISTGLSIPFNQLGNTNNVVFGVIRNGGNNLVIAGSNFTELWNDSLNSGGEAEYAINQTNVGWTWTSQPANQVAQAIEIKVPGSAVVSSFNSDLGINIGNDIANGGTFNLAQVQADANYHKAIGIKYVRVATPGFFYTNGASQSLTNIHTLVQTYLVLGINVQYVLAYGNPSFNASKESAYNTYVSQEAAWAQSVGVQRFQVANEMEIQTDGSLTQAQVYTYLQTLPALVKAAGFTGKITYSVSQGNWSAWSSIGNFDDIGLDDYGTPIGSGSLSTFVSEANNFVTQLGVNTYVSEWGAYADLVNTDPQVEAQKMLSRYQFLQSKFNLPCYLFTWRFLGDSYAIVESATGNYRLFWYILLMELSIKGIIAVNSKN